MKIYEALKAKLAETTAVTSIVSDRIYPLSADQSDKLPLIIYDLSLVPENDLSHTLYNKAELQIDCYAANFDAAMELGYAVRDALHVAKVTWGGGSGVRIEHCKMNRLDPSVIEVDSGVRVYIASVQFSLLYGSES